MTQVLSEHIYRALKAVDTPTICHAIEAIQGRRRNDGFTRRPVIAAHPHLPAMVGFAKTAIVRSDQPSQEAAAIVRERRLAYYRYVAEGDHQRVVVIEDCSVEKGLGAFWGEVNVALHQGLGLEGALTDGSIRDLGVIDPKFPLLGGVVSPSHAFVRVEDMNIPITVFGLAISPGDLIHADRHGAVIIEPGIESELPRAIDLVTRKEKPLL
ncbi:MAG: RraA family protein, partial [Beijerinckiaceae bacterium]